MTRQRLRREANHLNLLRVCITRFDNVHIAWYTILVVAGMADTDAECITTIWNTSRSKRQAFDVRRVFCSPAPYQLTCAAQECASTWF